MSWLTDSGRLTHKVIIRPTSSKAQDRESSLVKDQHSTTVLRRRLISQLVEFDVPEPQLSCGTSYVTVHPLSFITKDHSVL